MREFSEEAREKLYTIINDVNDEQWCEFTDWLGDSWGALQEWIGVLGIEEYGNNVDKYHRIMIDKNNASKNEIDKIYTDVENVDISYKNIFGQLVETVNEQKAFIDNLAEAINPSKGISSVNVALINLPDLSATSNLKLIYSYVEMIRNGNGDGVYDYDYIREIMEMNPDEISPYMYAALVLVFKEMNDRQKTMFVENSYFCTEEFWADPSGNGAGTWEYQISDVFQQMTAYYGQILSANISSGILCDKGNSNYEIAIENLLAFNTMSVFAMDYQSIYVPGMNVIFNSDNITELDIRIETVQTDTIRNNCKITISGSNQKYSETEMGTPMSNNSSSMVDVYSYLPSLETILDESVIRKLENMKIDTEVNITSGIINGISNVILGFVDLGNVGGTTLTISQDVITGLQSYIDVQEVNSEIEGMQGTIRLGNILSAIGAGGTMYIDSEGNYRITSMMIDSEILSENLNAYKEYCKESGMNCFLSYEEICSAFQKNKFELLGMEFNAFVQWCGEEGKVSANK